MEVKFPILSRQVPDTEGVLATWFVSDGQFVKQDELIAEVQVEKVSAEVKAPVSGRIRLLAKEQDVVSQNSVIALID
ncbi:MAG: biotin/lipoyl-binding protein [Actinomycetota bacterium]|nr:MAG: biotin/lipoyl-binding protein [Actinomycetota bacterium]